ncbi:M48 family metalloprotease [Paraconexibacter sp. AEG42_29]
MSPRSGVLEPRPIDITGYFSAAAIDRARDYRDGVLWIALAALALKALLLIALVARPPEWLTRVRKRPIVAGAAAGAALSLALALVTVPLDAVAHARAVDVGLSTQDWGAWAADLLRRTAVGALMAAPVAAIAIAVVRRAPRRWWIPGSGLIVVLGALFVTAGPVVLDPLFNDFTPLRGQARADVLQLARAAGVEVDDVQVVDASRRTTAANAYVTGLGHTKRVVIYDTLLRRFTRAERRLVIAHELGHVRRHDVPRGLLYLLLVAPFGTLAVARLGEALAPRGARGDAAGPGTLPALVLALALVALPMTWISNQLSRRVEARADTFALELTRDPDAFIAFERRITLQNISNPDPPRLSQWLFGTHPTIRERIGAGEAQKRAGGR